MTQPSSEASILLLLLALYYNTSTAALCNELNTKVRKTSQFRKLMESHILPNAVPVNATEHLQYEPHDIQVSRNSVQYMRSLYFNSHFFTSGL
jgi:hypothetical protein